MKRNVRNAMIGFFALGIGVLLTVSGLSAAIGGKGPLSSFDATFPEWAPDAGCLPVEGACPAAPPKPWMTAVQSALSRIDKVEEHLSSFSAGLRDAERKAHAPRVASVLVLDGRRPARDLETFLHRFHGMIDAYAGLDEETKGFLSDMAPSERIGALSAIAEKEGEWNAYFEGLAERHRLHVGLQEQRQRAAFETAFGVRVHVQAASRFAARRLQADLEAVQAVDRGLPAEGMSEARGTKALAARTPAGAEVEVQREIATADAPDREGSKEK